MKIIALYLPQFHEIKENNEWWGKGYTEWTAVKKAKPLFTNHQQPVEPLNDNYYDLSDITGTPLKQQATLAKKYEVFGFCFYHYWFKTGSQLLEKPMEILLEHKEIDINYCICWANETWKRTWYSEKNQVLKKQEYGDEVEWVNHYNYLKRFFQDKRYIKEDNKPMILIYHSKDIQCLDRMVECWNRLAKMDGFSGVYIVSANTGNIKQDNRINCIDAYYNYEPGFTKKRNTSILKRATHKIKIIVTRIYNRVSNKKVFTSIINSTPIYDQVDQVTQYNGKKCYLGTFTGYDDTPRRQYRGDVYTSSVEKFKQSLIKIDHKLKKIGRQDDYVFITAWNEWGEGAHLEPDKKNGYKFLDAIRQVMNMEDQVMNMEDKDASK